MNSFAPDTWLLHTLLSRTRPRPCPLGQALFAHVSTVATRTWPGQALPLPVPRVCHPDRGLCRPSVARTRRMARVRSSLPWTRHPACISTPRCALVLLSIHRCALFLSPVHRCLGCACMQTAHGRESDSFRRFAAINSEAPARCFAKSYPRSLARSHSLCRFLFRRRLMIV